MMNLSKWCFFFLQTKIKFHEPKKALFNKYAMMDYCNMLVTNDFGCVEKFHVIDTLFVLVATSEDDTKLMKTDNNFVQIIKVTCRFDRKTHVRLLYYTT